MHFHPYIGADRRVLGIRERDVWLASGNGLVVHGERTVGAERGGHGGRETEP